MDVHDLYLAILSLNFIRNPDFMGFCFSTKLRFHL
jgi:hypothetical protein